jgi:hypothetical protein
MSMSFRNHGGRLAAVAALAALLATAGPAAAAPGQLSWQRIEPPAMSDSIIRDVTSNAGVLLAVGSIELEAGIWLSRDATHWSRIDVDDIGHDTVLQSVTPWRRGFAAVGLRYTFDSHGMQRDAVVMTSTDARHWRRADLPGGHGALPNAVAVHQGMLVAGGCTNVLRFGCLFAADGRAVVWTSSDGRAWTRQLLPDGQHAFVNAIASVGERLILAGSEVSVEETEFGAISSPIAAAIWDGHTAATAQRVRDEALDAGRANGVVAYRGTYVAVGSRAACVESWTRRGDGWTTVDDSTALCDEEMSDVAAFQGSLYATGFRYFYERLPVWRTRDLRHWTTVMDTAFTSGNRMFEGTAVLVWHGRLLIAGTAFGDAAPGGAIWLGTTPEG